MGREHNYYIYILANKRNGTLYIGVTKSIYQRVFQHKEKKYQDSFTSKYGIDKLVYFENYQDINQTLEREKQLKKWNRAWKIKLIEKENPTWRDLFLDMDF